MLIGLKYQPVCIKFFVHLVPKNIFKLKKNSSLKKKKLSNLFPLWKPQNQSADTFAVKNYSYPINLRIILNSSEPNSILFHDSFIKNDIRKTNLFLNSPLKISLKRQCTHTYTHAKQ